jgi:toxin ParE1/3/4
MARIELVPEVFDDFDRFFDHLAQSALSDAPARMAERLAEIVQAVNILTHSPLIGRKVKGGKRELVIGQGSRGYVALYRFVTEIDTVFILAIRSQRESGYPRER